MEQKNYGDYDKEELAALRHIDEQLITQAINRINGINVELNTRAAGRTALPEFGHPMHSITPAEDDPFLEKVHPDQLTLPEETA